MTYPEVIDKYMSYAIGTDLDAWRNTDAALTAAECQATDGLISLDELKHTYPKTVRIGRGGYIQHRHDAGRVIGSLTSTHYLQRALFAYELMGKCVTTRTGKETTTVVCTSGATMVDGSYFLINCVDGAGATVKNYVWFNMGGDADPTPAGYIEIQVDYLVGDTDAEVAGKLKVVMDAGNYTATAVTKTVTIVTANNGAVEDATDVDTTLTIAVTVQGASLHTITLNASQTPINTAIHYESELTGEDVRADLLGFVPKFLSTTCNEFADGYVAYQTYNREFAYSRFSASNLAEPTKITDKKLSWEELATGGITFKYNGTDVEADVLGVTTDEVRTSLLMVRDGSGYPTKGKLLGFDFSVKLRVKSTGSMLKTIAATAKASYAGDLNLTLKWQVSATLFVTKTYSKLYLVPESLIDKITFDEEGWFTGYELLLEPYDDTSSLIITDSNKYDKTYYEHD